MATASPSVTDHGGGDGAVPLLGDDAKIGDFGAADGERGTLAPDSNPSPEP